MSDVTRILSQIESGDPSAAEQLLPLVYEELRKLAAVRISLEKPGQTLQATALVHDAYLRLVGPHQNQHWESRGHFFAAAAESMRRILVDQARKKASLKAGGDLRRVDISRLEIEFPASQVDILELHEALVNLESADPRAAKVVKLRYFAGLSLQETADSLGVSLFTVKVDWNYAKNWLRAAIET
jgi:RNA polymerase sigma factor (TIGR02999 family)